MRTEQILLGWLLSSCVSAIWLPAADGADADDYGAEELDNTIVDSPHGVRAANQHYVVNYRFAPDAQREIDLASDTANSYGQVGEYDCWTETPCFQPPHGSVLGCLETWRRYQRIGFNSMRLSTSVPTRHMLETADEAGYLLIPEGWASYPRSPGTPSIQPCWLKNLPGKYTWLSERNKKA